MGGHAHLFGVRINGVPFIVCTCYRLKPRTLILKAWRGWQLVLKILVFKGTSFLLHMLLFNHI